MEKMKILSDLKMYGRFAWGLPGFLRHPITLEEAKAIVQRRMAEREENFLRLVRKGIFGYPKSPYLPLLKLAQCEMGDIEQMVKRKGLEDTLRALREGGVYVTFEEFKGREPIIRNGQVIYVKTYDFDNPYISRYYQAESGGTTGAGTRVFIDLNHLADIAPSMMIGNEVHGLLHLPTAIWYGALPDGSGLHTTLFHSRFGHFHQKWFSPVIPQEVSSNWKYYLANQTIVVIGRLLGKPIPQPQKVSLDQASLIAHWVADTLRSHGKCVVRAHVSLLLRISLAAIEEGLDLTGATFLGGGEPPTPAKVKGIRSSGARYVPVFFTVESGSVGIGCVRPIDENDLHLFRDMLAIIPYPHQLPEFESTVNAFHFTTLLSSTPKLLLNVESDDYGIVENRSCGCPLEAYGFTEHLRQVRSFRKLTGEGVTLVGSEMIQILEEVLPSHFGGSPLDYQLVEEEDEKGFTRISLLVNPKIQIGDEEKVIKTVCEALSNSSLSANLTRTIWSQAETFRVKRMEPVWTNRGKLMSIRLIK
jgi:hypothetical protein